MKERFKMTNRTLPLLTAAVAIGAVLAGCGGSSAPKVQPPSKLESVPGSATGQIVLTQLGAQRIGLKTGPVIALRTQHRKAGAQQAVAIPDAAIVYDASGQTFAFRSVGPLRFTEVPVTVTRIAGNVAYLAGGRLTPGSSVATTGAEELYGVQTGVLAQT
jgi:hypothetical protein